MVPFGLSVLGVYLTRSGVTGSIHAFAEDPLIGRILLGAALLTVTLVGALALRAPSGTSWGPVDTRRGSWMWSSAALVTVATVFVLVGSAYPAFLEVFWGTTVVVDPRFFVVTTLPVALALALLIGFALETTWQHHGITRRRVLIYAAVAVVAWVVIDSFVVTTVLPGITLAALSAGALALLAGGRRLPAARLAHAGLVIVLIGAGASSMGAEFQGTMSPGDQATVGGVTIELTAIATGEEDRYQYAEAVFQVDDGPVLRPQIRAYEDQPRPVAEPALWSTPVQDLIIAVSVLSPDVDSFEVSVFLRPMVWWVWLGALLTALGGLFALFGKGGGGAVRRRSARAVLPTGETTVGTTDR
jgi:cytochrome c-type biogenesis protein CcmF